MEFTIRTAVREDMPQVLVLINQLAAYENEADAVEVTVQDLQNDGFGESPVFKCFVGEINNKIEGMALIFNRYSTWKGRILHLEDIIVNEPKRRLGMGSALLDEVVKYAHKQGVKRINWDVLDWNEPAIKFYEKKGAKVLRDWDIVWLDQTGINNYIEKLPIQTK